MRHKIERQNQILSEPHKEIFAQEVESTIAKVQPHIKISTRMCHQILFNNQFSTQMYDNKKFRFVTNVPLHGRIEAELCHHKSIYVLICFLVENSLDRHKIE